MDIAILGTGMIGSTFAYHLAKAGHNVTTIARGQRLAQLQSENAIVTIDGDRAPVTALAELDTTIAYDLVLVTVLAPQVDTVMPALVASPAKTIMFMFNTWEPLTPLEEAVGKARFAFGFPAVFASLIDGKLKSKVYTSGQVTTVSDAAWAKVFTDAGIMSVVDNDMHSWLRTHAALVVPMMAMGVVVYERKKGVSWSEARKFARAWARGFELVREVGNTVAPAPAVFMSKLPGLLVTAMLWTMSRLKVSHELGALGANESRMLIDSMVRSAPSANAELTAIRP